MPAPNKAPLPRGPGDIRVRKTRLRAASGRPRATSDPAADGPTRRRSPPFETSWSSARHHRGRRRPRRGHARPPVAVVDARDLAFGTSSRSSRPRPRAPRDRERRCLYKIASSGRASSCSRAHPCRPQWELASTRPDRPPPATARPRVLRRAADRRRTRHAAHGRAGQRSAASTRQDRARSQPDPRHGSSVRRASAARNVTPRHARPVREDMPLRTGP